MGGGGKGDEGDEGDLAAGAFPTWLAGLQRALRGEAASEVACGTCTACCTASQFVHIGPDEADTLAHIPARLVFRAPRLPPGHVLLGYDERGHCPMLIDNRCSIYDHRPRTCRTYDCRVFSAAGIGPDDNDPAKALIARRAGRWRFTFPTGADRTRRDAIRAAAAFVERHAGRLSEDGAPADVTQRAVLAIEIHHLFVHHDGETRGARVVEPDVDAVRAEVRRLTGAGQSPSRRAPDWPPPS
jgi:Fe-S-cluster containining protein